MQLGSLLMLLFSLIAPEMNANPFSDAIPALSHEAVVADTIPFINGWSKTKILATTKGLRPKPAEYLPQAYIFNYEDAFQGGASYLVPKSVLDKYGRSKLGRPDGQFITTQFDMDWILADANGRLKDIEAQLGIPAGTWAGQEIVRIDIKDPCAFNLRMPSGNEMGANNLWLPGGRLPTNYFEAVIDPIPAGYYTETTIKLK